MKTFLFIFILSFTGLSNIQSQDIRLKVSDFLQLEKENLSMQEVIPPYTIPMIKANTEKVFAVPFQIEFKGSTKELLLYFSKEGHLVRGESVTKLSEDPWRLSLEDIEKQMISGTKGIASTLDLPKDFDFFVYWSKIAETLNMEEATEFNFTFVNYQFYNDAIKPVMILNVWGINNPLILPEEFPEKAKNRMRAFFDLKGQLLAGDNML